ncbi:MULTISPECIES: SRPBCC family protein [Dactylosporangium]|uniref:Uncharacterized protein n=2 Tax=Dactylosporangium TaxID=35753 RepID=A0A9W6KS65_9ACTN|nr:MULTISPECIES: SRPBCC family protein [Dactylosporangium]UAB92877.1 SRPBCC family protein [Dactylosporangium vinaceum]UWZ41295.1 SRPBCC family protein [Dactylosporangium matsuzakiense]GLL05674.1 hypothetical protein GCM10017581_074210 [Dactylosporangium matsuzakiense]
MLLTQDAVRVSVPAMSAYEHLVHFEEYPRFMSGVLACTPADDTSAHLTLDVGGCRVDLDAVLAEARPGAFVRWESAAMIESFWLEETPDGCTDVAATVEFDDPRVHLYSEVPEHVLRNRLRMDLKGFKRLCEESAAVR